jgi:hypothetical protein
VGLAIRKKRFDDDSYEQLLNREEVETWQRESGLGLGDFFDHVGAQLAIEFFERRLPFDFCGAVANSMNGWLLTTFLSEIGNIPPLFWEVYNAFDDGEYHRENVNEDPPELYTRPLIAEIVAKPRA